MARTETITAQNTKWGRLFTRVKDGKTYMRVRPVSYVLNSTLVQETLNEGKLFVVEVASGDLKIIPKEDKVTVNT